MTDSQRGDRSQRWVVALRVVLGLLILFTGLGKALDLAGFAAIVGTTSWVCPVPSCGSRRTA